jgi:hypothetical protein
MPRLTSFALIFFLFVFLNAALAETTIYTTEAAWESATGGPGEVFPFSASNVSLAQEVGGPPAPGTFLGQIITFLAADTGLPVSFNFSCDIENQFVRYYTNALGASLTSHHDWSLWFFGDNLYRVGVRFTTNYSTADNTFRVFDEDGVQLAAHTPMHYGSDVFIGVVSDTRIGRIQMDDTTSSGGILATALVLEGEDISGVPHDEPATSWCAVKSLYR